LFLLWFHVCRKQRADFLYPLADSAVVSESERLRYLHLRVAFEQEFDDSLIFPVQTLCEAFNIKATVDIL
jgi:hypothetical protein